jgi:hypothetical protein
MIKTASRMMMAAAAASMAFAPAAVQANTRAGDSKAVYSVASSKPGLGRAAKGESAASGTSIVIAILATVAVIGGVFAAADSNDNGQSPGT